MVVSRSSSRQKNAEYPLMSLWCDTRRVHFNGFPPTRDSDCTRF